MAPTQPSRTEPRLAGRVQYNVFDPETAYFYAGTYGGTKKVISLGAGFDHQNEYTAFAVDGFVDWPIGGDVVTAQGAFFHYDGGAWIPAVAGPTGLFPQNDFVVELGYRLGALKISPIIRFENQAFDAVGVTDAHNRMFVSAGGAWWWMGHNLNVKAFYTYGKDDVTPTITFNQVNLQVQFYVF
jgi:hypothetical protein